MSMKMHVKKKIQVVFILLTAMALSSLTLTGCGPAQSVKQPPTDIEQPAAPPGEPGELEEVLLDDNRITDLRIEETPVAFEVVISANHIPDFTLAEPPFQQARVLYFPDAGLALDVTEVEIDNEIIGPVKATELVAGGPSKIEIPLLTADAEYEVRRVDRNVLKVIFPKAVADPRPEVAEVEPEVEAPPAVKEEPIIEEPKIVTAPEAPASATTLQAVDVTRKDNQVEIKVVADGSVQTFRSFTLSSPPRIVIDLEGIESPYEEEHRLAVDSDIVRQVRHFSHPDYVRLVIDVDPDYLADYDAETIRDGLLVSVGGTMVTAKAAIEEKAAVAVVEKEAPAPPVIRDYEQPAQVNTIDFIEESSGRSIIQIGTTHPVDYDMVRVDDKQLRLQLEGANIHRTRQRPLITTRFNSAVDVIAPLQTETMKKEKKTFIDIQLRESVSYEVEQEDNLILVRFAPSTIAPDPAREVAIPTDHVVRSEVPDVVREVVPPEDPEVAPPVEPRPEPPAVAVVEPEVEIRPEVETGIDADIVDIIGPEPKKRYTGEPIAMDFYKTDIRNVIRILKDVSGKNFAVDKDVSGSVTLNFVNPVPWDQVLDLILEMNDLGLLERPGIIRIATRNTMRRQKEEARAELAAQQALRQTEEELAPLVTEYFAVSYSQAGADVLPHIQDMLSTRGHAKVDGRTNQVIMTDTPDRIEKAREIIEKIDKVTPQVMISARVVETTSSFSRAFGTEWGADNQPGAYRRNLGGTYGYNVALNNPAAASNTLGVSFSRIVGTPFSLDARLSLMETTGKVNIISSPRIVTLNNKTASISQGQEFPYQTVEDGNVKVEFKDAELRLEVTPQVTPDNRIAMRIFIEEKEIGQAAPGQEPPLNTKEARTELLVNDGDTVVIGGIIQQTERESTSGLPFISRIPVLGHLFKSTARSNEKTELMIFITPTVVRLD